MCPLSRYSVALGSGQYVRRRIADSERGEFQTLTSEVRVRLLCSRCAALAEPPYCHRPGGGSGFRCQRNLLIT
jgi:hypothetical protein